MSLDNAQLNGFVDGFLRPFALLYKVSRYLDGVGRRIADWLVP